MREKNNDLYGVIENLMEKYTQYADLFAPLLETHKIDPKIWCFDWSSLFYHKL